MATGLNRSLTAAEINQRVGSIARDDAALAGYGLSTDDITLIRTVVADLVQLRNLYLGTATLTVAYDHRTFARRIWGLGF